MDYNTLRNHVGTARIPFWILHPPTSFHPLNSGGIVVFDIRSFVQILLDRNPFILPVWVATHCGE